MSAHTPGKWLIAGELVYALNDEPASRQSNRFTACLQRGWATAETRTTEQEMAANARLIAAAPELLAALRTLVAADKLGELDNALFAAAAAVIAKATGEQA